MAYIPPHKRHSAGGSGVPSPTPYLPPPPSISKLSLSSPDQRPKQGCRKPPDGPAGTDRRAYPTNSGIKIAYADSAIWHWWWVSAGRRVDHSDLRLECFPREYLERWIGDKPLVLVASIPEGDEGDNHPPIEADGAQQPALIARRILPDLLASATSARGLTAAANEVIKLSVAARIGKVLFNRNYPNTLESIRRSEFCETNADTSDHISKFFYTDVPNQFLQHVEQLVQTKAGFDFESEGEDYHVKVFDTCRPDSTIACKCALVNGSLQILKIQLNQVRHLVVDVSCLHKDSDFRVMLHSKRILSSLDDDEKDGIDRLISSAIIDSDVKGGLRWPPGKDAIAERFSVGLVWRTSYRIFRSERMRLKLRRSERFSHKTSFGETTNEVTIKLSGIAKHLRAVEMEADTLLDMLQEALEFIWNDLLSFNFKPFSS